eukprot:139047_1
MLVDKLESYIRDNPNFPSTKLMIKRYMRRKDGIRFDMNQAWNFEPDIQDPCVNITDENRLKYLFYKACIKSIQGFDKADQDALMEYIDELMNDPERCDPNDLLYYQKYKILDADENAENAVFPIIEIVDPDEIKKTIRYQPFILIYQSKTMRNDIITYGKNILSLDSTFGTTKYGFKLSAFVMQNEFKNVTPGAIFIMQHETQAILNGMFTILEDHIFKVSAHLLNPKAVITDKDDTEISAVRKQWPDARNWLCLVHDNRTFDRKLPPYVGKQGAMVLKPLLNKMQYVYSTEKVDQTKERILAHPLVVDNPELIDYLNTSWFNCAEMWCFAFRDIFHNE